MIVKLNPNCYVELSQIVMVTYNPIDMEGDSQQANRFPGGSWVLLSNGRVVETTLTLEQAVTEWKAAVVQV